MLTSIYSADLNIIDKKTVTLLQICIILLIIKNIYLMRTLILIIFAIISYNIQGQLLSIKKLLQKPIYVYYNDTLFTLDENCNKVYPKSFTEIYRLKVYPLCERKLMPWCAPYDYPYYDFTKIGSLLGSMTNLQELNLYNLPLWEFPKEILSLKRIQILDLQIDIEDCVENNFLANLFQMNYGILKLLNISIYLHMIIPIIDHFIIKRKLIYQLFTLFITTSLGLVN